jgi:hypothetical protein
VVGLAREVGMPVVSVSRAMKDIWSTASQDGLSASQDGLSASHSGPGTPSNKYF